VILENLEISSDFLSSGSVVLQMIFVIGLALQIVNPSWILTTSRLVESFEKAMQPAPHMIASSL
jgi:hypothetical protein